MNSKKLMTRYRLWSRFPSHRKVSSVRLHRLWTDKVELSLIDWLGFEQTGPEVRVRLYRILWLEVGPNLLVHWRHIIFLFASFGLVESFLFGVDVDASILSRVVRFDTITSWTNWSYKRFVALQRGLGEHWSENHLTLSPGATKFL
jgi:hypothetical protein